MKIEIDVPDGVSGDWEVSTFTVSNEAAKFNNIRAMFSFSAREILPGTYKRLTRNNHTIMSNTPVEIQDHLHFIRKAKESETILINGLGLGVALAEILKSDTPKEITVVEQSEDVINLVAPTYTKDARVHIVHADALTYKAPKGKRFNIVWHDIWDNICADNNDSMSKLHRKYGQRSDWQDSWARYEVKRELRDSNKRYGWL